MDSIRRSLVSIYTYFPVIYLVILGQALRRSHGHLRLAHLVYLSLSLLVFFGVYFNKKIRFSFAQYSRYYQVTSCVWLLFSLFLSLNSELIYVENKMAHTILRTCLGINFVLSILNIYSMSQRIILNKRFYVAGLGLSFIALILVPIVSPNPHIDVYEYARLGAHYLFDGINPYTQVYPDLYNGRYELTRGFVYWPVATYLYTLGELIFNDVRAFFVVAHLISIFFIYRISRSLRLVRKQALINTLIWVSFPVTYFVLEQAWLDAFTIPFLFGFGYFLYQKEYNKAAIFLGIICASKQYMVFTAILTYAYLYRELNFRNWLKFIGASTLTGIVTLIPFLAWGAEVFIEKTVIDILTLGFRDDALSWVAYFARFHDFKITGAMSGTLYIVSLAALSFYLFIDKNKRLFSLFGAMVIQYFIIFLFGKQAFCNYYYMLASMLYISILFYFFPPLSGQYKLYKIKR